MPPASFRPRPEPCPDAKRRAQHAQTGIVIHHCDSAERNGERANDETAGDKSGKSEHQRARPPEPLALQPDHGLARGAGKRRVSSYAGAGPEARFNAELAIKDERHDRRCDRESGKNVRAETVLALVHPTPCLLARILGEPYGAPHHAATA